MDPSTRRIQEVVASVLGIAMKKDLSREFSNYAQTSFLRFRAIGEDGGERPPDSLYSGPPRKKRRLSYLQDTERLFAKRLVQSVHNMVVVFNRPTRSVSRKISKIQRWWRYWSALRPSMNHTESGVVSRGSLRYQGKNCTCPISLDIIPFDNCVKLIGDGGHVTAYKCSDLVAYLMKQNDFKCPLTRRELNLVEIKRIRNTAFRHGIRAFGLLETFENRDALREAALETQNAVLALERTCAEALNAAIRYAELEWHPSLSRVSVIHALEHDLLSEWGAYVRLLGGMDFETCQAMLAIEDARIVHLSGRLSDPFQLLPRILSAVRSESRFLTEQRNRRSQSRPASVLVQFPFSFAFRPFVPPPPPPPPSSVFRRNQDRRRENDGGSRASMRSPNFAAMSIAEQ